MSASSDEAFVLQVLEALEQTGLEALVVGSVAAILRASTGFPQPAAVKHRLTGAPWLVKAVGRCPHSSLRSFSTYHATTLRRRSLADALDEISPGG